MDIMQTEKNELRHSNKSHHNIGDAVPKPSIS